MTLRRALLTMGVLATALVVVIDVTPAGADHGDITVFADGEAEVDSPTNLILGPDGKIWFTSPGSNRIGRIDPAAADPAASITTFVDAGIVAPWDLVTGPDGNIWFTADGAVGRIDPGTGTITDFPDGNIDDGRGIAVGPDDNLWFASQANDRIGRVTVDGVVTTFTDPGIHSPTAVAPYQSFESPGSPPDAVWFTNTGDDDLGRVVLPDETIGFVEVVGLDDPTQIELLGGDVGPGVGFVSAGNDRLGSCDVFWNCSLEPPAPVDGLGGFSLDHTGPVSRLWLIGLDDDVLHVTANTRVQDFTSADVVDPAALLPVGGDELWFTVPSTDRIGRLEVDGTSPTVSITSPVDGATYTRGSLPPLQYSCADEPGGAGLEECSSGLGPSGSALPDDGIGPYRISAGAYDNFGNIGVDSIEINVVATTSCDGLPATIELEHGDDPTGNTDDVIVGTPGDDVIETGWGDDVVCGNGGDDQITTGPFSDRVFGGPGDDEITSSGQDDELNGGDGDDLIDGGDGDDHVVGGIGIDTIDGGTEHDRIEAGPGADVVDGGTGDDEILGEAGFDTLRAGDGNDEVHGGTERDVLDLGSGADDGFGGTGDDTLKGGFGRDLLEGGAGRDRAFGANGNDVLKGATGDDLLDAGYGDDKIYGADGADVGWGREGRDVLDGGNQDDTLNGGPHHDVCFGRAGGGDVKAACEVSSGFP